MSKSRKMTDTYDKKRGLLLLRVCSPSVFLLLMTVSLYIPCLRFTTADAGTTDVISAAALVRNAWGQVRQFLFGGGTLTAANETFSWAVLILIVLCVLLFLLAAIATVWWTVGAILYARDGEESGNARALYVTLFPNRIVTCVWQGLVLPLLAFPRLLTVCYDKILYYPVILNVTFPEPLVIGGALYLISLVLFVISKKGELAMGVSPYRVKRAAFSKEKSEEKTEGESLFSTAPHGSDGASDIERSSREEQAERIRQLLNRQGDREE